MDACILDKQAGMCYICQHAATPGSATPLRIRYERAEYNDNKEC